MNPEIPASKLDTIRKLLDQAAEGSGATDAEREAFAQRAAEMMARYSVDAAMIADRAGAAADPVESRRIPIPTPYVRGKQVLLTVVAKGLGCRAIMGDGFGVLYGHVADLERADFLYTHLLIQGMRMQSRAVPPTVPTAFGERSVTAGRTRSYRASWLLGFASRIGDRMDEARASAVADAPATGGRGAELVLASRDGRVDALVRVNHPRARTVQTSPGSLSGYAAGTSAANRADLGAARVSGTRRSLAT